MQLLIALDFFLSHCYSKGLFERTIMNYDSFNRNFIKAIGNPEVSAVDYELVLGYVSSLYKRNLSRATIGTYITHMKVFLRYLEEEHYIKEPFVSKIKVPRKPKKLVKIYLEDEIKEIFESIDILPLWLRYRNCSLIALMLDSGLRLNELCCFVSKPYRF